MKKQLLSIVAAAGMMLFSVNAQALLVAGWDFSQYIGDGETVVDFDYVPTDTLGANYSSLVQPAQTLSGAGGLGPAAAQYGTMYINGQFGSVNNQAGSGTEVFLPSAAVGGSLASNLNATVNDGFLNPFDSLTLLAQEGQVFQSLLAMTALASTDVVFSATPPLPGTDWNLSFGGRSQGGTSSVEILFSTDGASYASRGLFQLSTTDTPYSLNLSPDLAQAIFVMFRFTTAGAATAPVIDNVALSGTLIPEPGTALLLLTGLAGLTVYGRPRA